MEFKLNNANVPNGTVLLFGIEYSELVENADETRGRTMPKIWTYAMLKAGGLWHVTGVGKVPQAAGWGAVQKWLSRDGRQVKWIKIVTEARQIWPESTPGPAAP